jgi:ureidoglycolate hydrolase
MSITVEAAVRPTILGLPVQELTGAAFAPFGQVIAPSADGAPFGPHEAQLDLARGTPRFYIMTLRHRPLAIRQITRHCAVTQCLAAVGGADWLIAVAPPGDADDPDAEPKAEDIVAFRVPGDVAIKLDRGTWHAGPFFELAELAFFNLELADTNIVDHDNCDLAARYGVVLEIEAA